MLLLGSSLVILRSSLLLLRRLFLLIFIYDENYFHEFYSQGRLRIVFNTFDAVALSLRRVVIFVVSEVRRVRKINDISLAVACLGSRRVVSEGLVTDRRVPTLGRGAVGPIFLTECMFQ